MRYVFSTLAYAAPAAAVVMSKWKDFFSRSIAHMLPFRTMSTMMMLNEKCDRLISPSNLHSFKHPKERRFSASYCLNLTYSTHIQTRNFLPTFHSLCHAAHVRHFFFFFFPSQHHFLLSCLSTRLSYGPLFSSLLFTRLQKTTTVYAAARQTEKESPSKVLHNSQASAIIILKWSNASKTLVNKQECNAYLSIAALLQWQQYGTENKFFSRQLRDTKLFGNIEGMFPIIMLIIVAGCVQRNAAHLDVSYDMGRI